MAPVFRCQLVSTLYLAKLTTMTGQRSRAEMKAKDVWSEVEYGLTGIATLDTMSWNVIVENKASECS